VSAANSPSGDISAAIPSRFSPWMRLAWAIVALVSIWTFVGTLVLTRRFADALPLRLVEGLVALGWTRETYFRFTIATIAPLFLVNFGVGSLIFWLRPRDRMAVFTSIFAMSIGAANSFSPAHEYLVVQANAPPAIAIPAFISGILSFGFLATFFATFPDGRIAPGWMRWIALEGFLFSLAWNLFPDSVGTFSGFWGTLGILGVLVMFGGSVWGQVWRYRHYATMVQKQQTKWFVSGLAFITVGILIPSVFLYSPAAAAASPRVGFLFDIFVSIGNLAFAFLPISIAIAILRYRLWDIDVIIRRTLQYTLLTGVLALIYFGGVVLLQALLSPLTGDENSPLVTVLTTLGIAALFNPLRTRVQAFIDRRLYRKKYNAEQSLARFAAAARSEVDMDRLADALLGVVEETMRPERVEIRLKS
jgi:hypothetical protein